MFAGFQRFLSGVGSGSKDSPFTPAMALTDGLGNTLSSFYHAATDKYILNIHDADVHNIPINQDFHQHLGVTSTLTVATASDGSDNTITVANGALFSVNDHIQLGLDAEHTGVHYHIQAIATNVLTLDAYVDEEWDIGTVIETITSDMNVNASLASPETFIIKPHVGEIIHVTRILISMTQSTAGDLGLFGNLAALTNGVLIRVKASGQYGSFTNWKANADLKNDMYDVEFDTRSGGGGTYGTSGRGSFSRIGVAVRLDGSQGDQMEIILQDDVSGLTSFAIKAQGHIEG